MLLLLLLQGCASIDQRFAQIKADSPIVVSVSIPVTWSAGNAERPGMTASPIDPKTSSTATLAAWWRQFNDPQLDTLIDEAMRAAPDLRTARAKLRQSRANRDLAVANLYPSIGASASSSRAVTGINAGGTGATNTLYAAGFDASWEPSIFGGLRDAATGARADTEAMAATLESTQASLAAEVALNYVTLRASQQRLAIARANLASQRETLQITQWREMAGLATSLDVEQARTNAEQTRATIPSLETSRASAEHHLAILTGRAPGQLRDTWAAALPLPTAPATIAVGIPADALRQRPDIRAAELTLKAETARLAQREADRYPSLALSGSFGWQTFALHSLTGGSANVVRSLAAELSTTLFDGGRIRSRIAAQSAAQEQALIAWEKSILTALEDVENALTAYAVGRERVDARRQAATAAGNAAQLARTQYQAGSADFQKVLETERTRLTAEDSLAAAEADVLTAVIQLYKALGGGWQPAATTDSPEDTNSSSLRRRGSSSLKFLDSRLRGNDISE